MARLAMASNLRRNKGVNRVKILFLEKIPCTTHWNVIYTSVTMIICLKTSLVAHKRVVSSICILNRKGDANFKKSYLSRWSIIQLSAMKSSL